MRKARGVCRGEENSKRGKRAEEERRERERRRRGIFRPKQHC